MSSATTTVVADHESSTSETRFTRAGRRIVYKVNVLQHPEKARACGQGPKSSTDRRPVDPPPIVDLRIFEEESDGSEKDITYSYRANFFMFASIEQARPIAQGRVQPKEPNTGPLLTGAPVSGISYLERPEPAGYFIFPDLSVRHEGRYRLAFTLYEEIRDSTLDDRVEQPSSAPATKVLQEHVYGRCVVRSKPFTVYSAKKFPGLSESTTLSRCVAEQGCRVRIRRDVRMRRRETKDKSRSWEDDEDEVIDIRSGHQQRRLQQENYGTNTPDDHKSHHIPDQTYQTPVEPLPRPRSGDAVSGATYHPSMQRTSSSDLGIKYQQGFGPPPHIIPQPQQHGYQPPAPNPYEQPAVAPSYPQHQYLPPQSVSQSPQQIQAFQPAVPPPPPYGYQSQPYYPYPQHYSYMPPQQIQPQMYPPPQSQVRHDSINYVPSPQDYQATAGAQQYPNPMHPSAPLGPTDAGPPRSTSVPQHTQQINPNGTTQGQPTTASIPSTSRSNSQPYLGKSLPPLQTQPGISQTPAYDHNSVLPAPVSNAPSLQPLQAPPPPYTPANYDHRPPPPQYINAATSGAPASKRSFGSTFDTHHVNQRLQSGARPGAGAQGGYVYPPADGPSDDEDNEPMLMEYRRADGTVMKRQWPKLY